MKAPDPQQDKPPDLVRDQAELVALLQSGVDPDLLSAVERAYHWVDDEIPAPTMEVSYEGTTYA